MISIIIFLIFIVISLKIIRKRPKISTIIILELGLISITLVLSGIELIIENNSQKISPLSTHQETTLVKSQLNKKDLNTFYLKNVNKPYYNSEVILGSKNNIYDVYAVKHKVLTKIKSEIKIPTTLTTESTSSLKLEYSIDYTKHLWIKNSFFELDKDRKPKELPIIYNKLTNLQIPVNTKSDQYLEIDNLLIEPSKTSLINDKLDLNSIYDTIVPIDIDLN